MGRSSRIFEILLFASFLFVRYSSVPPAWADYEIYQEKSFQKVAEIVEKKENPDGTYTVKVRKKKGDTEIVEITGVKRIVETEAKKDFKAEYIPKATPTPVWRPQHPGPIAVTTPVEDKDLTAAEEEEARFPGLAGFLRSLPNIGIIIMGIAVVVVLGFVLVKTSRS